LSNLAFYTDRNFLATAPLTAVLRYRCGWNSVAVASEMGLTPVKVRQTCFRVLRVARAMGLETFEPHRSRGRKR